MAYPTEERFHGHPRAWKRPGRNAGEEVGIREGIGTECFAKALPNASLNGPRDSLGSLARIVGGTGCVCACMGAGDKRGWRQVGSLREFSVVWRGCLLETRVLRSILE